MDPYLVKEIKKLSKKDTGREEIEKLLDQYLEIHPKSVEALIRLAVTVFGPPIADYDKSIDCLKRAIEIDPDCLEAILILARIQDTIYREIEDDVFNRINSIKVDNNEEQSMIEFAKSWYYESKEMWNEYVNHLKKSIEAYSGHVLNYVSFGMYNIEKGEKEKGKLLLLKGIRNVKHIYRDDDHFYDVSDYNEFINERIKGTHVTDVIYGLLEERIKSP